ncbi:MAG: hypothetical protein L6Q92_08030 [Phycisphaerae bacterium]|nr:hypothetical protein [Phycisphaerae bacterium]
MLNDRRRELCIGCSFVLLLGAGVVLHAQPAERDVPATQPSDARAPQRPDRPPLVEPRDEPSASDVLERLMPREGVPQPIVRPVVPGQRRPMATATEALPKNAVVPLESRLLPDGYRLVDRPGRLQREGDFWVFAFESRSTQAAEPPMRLLPNRMLEDMEIASAGGTRSIVFLISGEVTEYHGVNYLLIQKMLVRPNYGNLR